MNVKTATNSSAACIRHTPKGWGGLKAAAAPKPKFKKNTHTFCRHDDIKRFTQFTLQLKSADD